MPRERRSPRTPSKPLPRLPLWTSLNFAGLILLWLLENFTSERIWPATLLTFTPQILFLLPTLILAVVCWKKKHRRLLAVQFAAALLWFVAFSNWNWPRLVKPAPSMMIRVMTYNIRYGSLGVQDVLRTITAQKPAILCIQEALPKGNETDPMPALRRGLPGYHIARYGELVIFSIFPVQWQRRHSLRLHNGSGILEAKLNIAGQPFTVFCAHFTNPIDGRVMQWPAEISTRSRIRQSQFRTLRFVTRRCKTPFFIAGDFNTGSRGSLYRQLAGEYTDCALASGWNARATFPARFPIERIDYFWTKSNVQVVNCRVINSTASDHRPLVGNLIIE